MSELTFYHALRFFYVYISADQWLNRDSHHGRRTEETSWFWGRLHPTWSRKKTPQYGGGQATNRHRYRSYMCYHAYCKYAWPRLDFIKIWNPWNIWSQIWSHVIISKLHRFLSKITISWVWDFQIPFFFLHGYAWLEWCWIYCLDICLIRN